MSYLKRLIIALVIDLALFFNIERLSFGDDYYHLISIQGFVYALGLAAILATLFLAPLWRSQVFVTLTLWLSLYFLGKVVVFRSPSHPLIGQWNTFITITEVVLLAGSIVLAHAIARALHDLEDAVERMTLTGVGGQLKKVGEVSDDIQVELARSRRYHSPVSVVVVDPDPVSFKLVMNRALEEIQRAIVARYAMARAAAALRNVLRRTDLILQQQDKGRFVVFSPETGAESARILAQHIQQVLASRLDLSVRCSTATFPDEALTFDGLVQQAEEHLRGDTVPSAVPVYGPVDSENRL